MSYTIHNNMDSNIKKFITDVKGLTEITLKKEIKMLLLTISSDYNINKLELFKKYMSDDVDDANITEQSKIVVNSNKCIAVTKNYKQCSRNKFNGNTYCKNHLRQSASEKGLPQGTVFEIITEPVNNKILNYVTNVPENETVLEKKEINNQTYYVNQSDNTHYIITADNTVKQVDSIEAESIEAESIEDEPIIEIANVPMNKISNTLINNE